MMRNKSALALLVLSAITVSAARAATVSVGVKAPHGTYTVWLFRTGDARPTATFERQWIAGFKKFSFSCPGDRRYFIRVRRDQDGFTRQTKDGYVGRWAWNSLDLGTLDMWGWN